MDTIIDKYLRFADLKARGIVTSWPQLRRKVDFENFPRGKLLGPRTRAWGEREVAAWLESRPVEGRMRGLAVNPSSRGPGRPKKLADQSAASPTESSA